MVIVLQYVEPQYGYGMGDTVWVCDGGVPYGYATAGYRMGMRFATGVPYGDAQVGECSGAVWEYGEVSQL